MQISYLCIQMMKRLIMAAGLVMVMMQPVTAQPSPQDLVFQREIDLAAELMDAGLYDSADYYLRHTIQNMKVLPTRISYYFGKNSLHLKRYKQSINWLNKYIELAGTTGQYFEESVQLLETAEAAYRDERSREIEEMVTELQDNKAVKCQENETVICPVCHGLGVVIKEKSFGKEFWPCPFSDDQGRLSCSEYNLLMQGKLKPKR